MMNMKNVFFKVFEDVQEEHSLTLNFFINKNKQSSLESSTKAFISTPGKKLKEFVKVFFPREFQRFFLFTAFSKFFFYPH